MSSNKLLIDHFQVAFSLWLKTCLHSYENDFRLQVHFHADQSDFHMKGIARGLVLKPRLEVAPKWRIAFCFLVMNL